ncbi:IclR family transcriptional regulator [Streptomyces justiciae]|uniref:IclR family transcriptional regulator n=1 Tax=Streptomyces justiciae TaxID=2780140 RepID=UPI0021188B1F|nr:IclR family transcriptional regulator [Streptomyces justiciae]MCW8379734.1 IclR family transcriptional regulator [Streptomyces justiciae]
MVRADSQAAGTTAGGPSILSKAFDVLRAFDSTNRVMTLTELSHVSGLPKSTVHRLLGRLVELGAVEHHGAAGYKIGLDLLRIGSATPALRLRDCAMPYLTSLQRGSGQAVYLGVLRGFDVVFLERLEPAHVVESPVPVGGRLPAHCTAIGKALLAYEDFEELAMFLPSPLAALTPHSVTSVDALIKELGQVRRLGFAHEHNEARQGLLSLAVPIVMQGFAIGALSVACPEGVRLDPTLTSALRDAAAGIARKGQSLVGHRTRWFPGPS